MTAVPAPEVMREAMAAYVRAVHEAYLDVADQLPPGDRARLPLLAAGDLTVAAVGTRYLHVLGTAEALPAPTGPEVELLDEIGPLTWRLRFFDPVLVPDLARLDESDGPQPQLVRGMLGIHTVAYHLSVPPGAGLTPHHAQHAGTGLAHSHAASVRDYATLRTLGADPVLIDEMQGAEVAGLRRAVRALARELLPDVPELGADEASNPEVARRIMLAALRGRG